MDNLALLQRTIDQASRLVEGTDDSQLGLRTPCAEWTVRDLINHITGGAIMFAVSAEQGSVPDEVLARISGDNLGDDFKQAWRSASAQAMNAFSQPDIDQKLVTLPFGQMPAAIAASIAIFDVTVHGLDLAKATGQTFDDAELLEQAYAMGKAMITDDFRKPGYFGPEQPAPADAPLGDRLLAFAGRSI